MVKIVYKNTLHHYLLTTKQHPFKHMYGDQLKRPDNRVPVECESKPAVSLSVNHCLQTTLAAQASNGIIHCWIALDVPLHVFLHIT